MVTGGGDVEVMLGRLNKTLLGIPCNKNYVTEISKIME